MTFNLDYLFSHGTKRVVASGKTEDLIRMEWFKDNSGVMLRVPKGAQTDVLKLVRKVLRFFGIPTKTLDRGGKLFIHLKPELQLEGVDTIAVEAKQTRVMFSVKRTEETMSLHEWTLTIEKIDETPPDEIDV